MAKKNLASLMNGIMGDIPKESSGVNENRQERIEPEGTTNDNTQRRKPGRPRLENKTEEIRATIIIDAELMRKVKYVSLLEDKMIKEVMNDALVSYISNWELENGKIKIPPKR